MGPLAVTRGGQTEVSPPPSAHRRAAGVGRAALVAGAVAAVVLPLVASLTGCQVHQPKTGALPATRPSLATTQPSYWYDQPGAYAVEAADFEKLFQACQDAAHHFGFIPDRLDRRRGIVTTVPLTSKQFFEFWHNDVATVDDAADASLATYRRTLRFDIQRLPAGAFRATPRVVVERYVYTERPITAQVYLRQAFRSERHVHPVGTPESDRGILIPRSYWYATGRDVALERNVASELGKDLAKS